MKRLKFGPGLRREAFTFAESYLPLNHGSYGAFPKAVRVAVRELQDEVEARSDPVIRFKLKKLVRESREALARLLGTAPEEVVLVPNATTAINTVLRNLQFAQEDIICYFNTAYGATEKSILYTCETTPASYQRIDVVFPLEDAALVSQFKEAVGYAKSQGHRVRLAVFDTVVTFPGARLPWELLTEACRELGVLSLVDGAHGAGHIDLMHLGQCSPDFFTSNLYKWLYTPRPSALLYVPSRNHHFIRSTLPTSHGFKPLDSSAENVPSQDAFGKLFEWVATIDQTPYCVVPDAIRFRSSACGGEAAIRDYCFTLARAGGTLMADNFGTEVMDNGTRTMSACCFTMVRLPLEFPPVQSSSASDDSSDGSIPALRLERGPVIARWITQKLMEDYDTWIPAQFYNGSAWIRVSAQIYLGIDDFAKAAVMLLELCERVKAGEANEEKA
ncbi:MAG: putative secondary metabolism biosynthetic enzyme [Bathelium mastoideum]|nr:MAG: putative secondary metabolism biosynthetic enzyme [Bathelium mastoideum]